MAEVATHRLRLGPMTFSELEVLMEEEIFDYRGDLEITDPHNSNIVLWNGWNRDAVDVFNSLVARGAEVSDAELEDYRRLYRRVPDLPLAVDRRCAYTSPHWAPSLLEEREKRKNENETGNGGAQNSKTTPQEQETRTD